MNKQLILASIIATTLSAGITLSGGGAAFADERAHVAPSTTSAPAPGAASAPAPGAASAKSAAAPDVPNADQELVKVSKDALLGVRDVHSARLAIFNGESERARIFVDAAKTRIDLAVNEAREYALDIKAPKSDDYYVPFDASLTIMGAYEPSEKKARHIAKANRHVRRGEQKQAVAELKLAEIEVAVSTGLVPIEFAQEHVAQASRLVADHKYYEANLALKAIDDSVVVETFAVDELPGGQGSGQAAEPSGGSHG
ncbi:MAG: YfdX family protein [Gammaproteobacteria bacterium]